MPKQDEKSLKDLRELLEKEAAKGRDKDQERMISEGRAERVKHEEMTGDRISDGAKVVIYKNNLAAFRHDLQIGDAVEFAMGYGCGAALAQGEVVSRDHASVGVKLRISGRVIAVEINDVTRIFR